MAINGVPAFGPQEADSNNAVLMTMAFRELDSGMLVTLLEVQPGMFTIPKWGKKQFHPTSFLVMPWMGFQFMALLTMTRYLNWIRAMEFITTTEVISIMFEELIRWMETSSIAMVIVLRLTGTTSLDVIPALSMILKCTIQQATCWMTTVSLMEPMNLLLWPTDQEAVLHVFQSDGTRTTS